MSSIDANHKSEKCSVSEEGGIYTSAYVEQDMSERWDLATGPLKENWKTGLVGHLR